ncbi:unnamed protein product, partial [Bubo scandiacus]
MFSCAWETCRKMIISFFGIKNECIQCPKHRLWIISKKQKRMPGLIYWIYMQVVAFWSAITGATLLQLF